MIRVHGLERNFGPRPVLRGLNLEIAPGSRIALMGPNGSGKTTLLRILAGFIRPSRGEAWIGGASVTEDPGTVRAKIGWVPATEGGFFPRLTGRENLELFGAIHGLSRQEIERRIAELQGPLRLETVLSRAFHECSSGMRQKLALARAMLPDPELLLLDEPTRSLDPEAASLFRRFLTDATEGKTIVISTHSEAEARQVASRVFQMKEGVACEA